ncbi:unnamed protein product [Ectocarpus sp. 12 AP-2014]
MRDQNFWEKSLLGDCTTSLKVHTTSTPSQTHTTWLPISSLNILNAHHTRHSTAAVHTRFRWCLTRKNAASAKLALPLRSPRHVWETEALSTWPTRHGVPTKRSLSPGRPSRRHQHRGSCGHPFPQRAHPQARLRLRHRGLDPVCRHHGAPVSRVGRQRHHPRRLRDPRTDLGEPGRQGAAVRGRP